MISYYTRMCRYLAWGDQKLLAALETVPTEERSPHLLMSHSVVTRVMWHDRIFKRPTPYALWEPLNLDLLNELSVKNLGDWFDLLLVTSEDSLSRPISYKNTSGVPFTTPLCDILTHVVNHSTHHRSQAAYAIRTLGLVPPATDFIFFVRETGE